MNCDNLIIYDWFSVTAKHRTPESIIALLGMDATSFKTVQGARGYRERLYLDGISVHFGGRKEVWLEMSGQGCRTFETFGHGDWDSLFAEVQQDCQYHITRLDVAFDDHEGILDLETIFNDVDAGNFVSKFDFWEIVKSSKGITIYHGSPASDVRFRIYDKAKERNREDDGHWVRFEIQLRDKKASNFLNWLILRPIGEAFIAVVNNYLRYVRPTKDSNKRRWPETEYWKRFVGEAEKISLYVAPGIEYNLERLERFAVTQAGAAAAAYVEIVGEAKYLELCRHKLAESMNPKYQELIQKQCRKLHNE